tara:strand:- start:94 stop:561 length:468 start_codon:yes stop_codon:yes gene_type:complete
MTEEFLLTSQGLEKLKKELLEHIALRRQIADRIRKAKEFGDLSENAEYSEAKEAQALNEAEISKLEMKVKNAVIVSAPNKSTGRKIIGLGSQVKIKTGSIEKKLSIVSPHEVDPANGKISNESPLGKALVDKCKGESVEVETPGGIVNYKILEIS